jgi:hypothetical protein
LVKAQLERRAKIHGSGVTSYPMTDDASTGWFSTIGAERVLVAARSGAFHLGGHQCTRHNKSKVGQ